MINVTKTYLPAKERYLAYLDRAWQKGWITNGGQLVLELEGLLRKYVGQQHLHLTSNGTVALQLALKTLAASGGEIITTPYSYVATSHAISWEGFKPVFVDIDPSNFCIDPSLVAAAITKESRAILATHVYGMPCDTKQLEAIGKAYGLPVIYDAAHAFGSTWQGESLLSFGNISTCSFHATKIFHTVEGGCVVSRDPALARQMELYRQFGHIGDEHYSIGINGKNSEMHAAMGLAILPDMPDIIAERKQIFGQYQQALGAYACLQLPNPAARERLEWNYAYLPVLFQQASTMLAVKKALEEEGIFPRRYFYPALHTLPFYQQSARCPVAESIAGRVLCLPFYNGLSKALVALICNRLIDCLPPVLQKAI